MISPHNSLDDNIALFESANCTIYVATKPMLALTRTLESKRPIKFLGMLETNYWLQTPHEREVPYAYDKSFGQAKLEPFVIVHTSGSTGAPKVMTQAHGTMAALDAYQVIHSFQGPRGPGYHLKSTRHFVPFPLFHSAAIGLVLGAAVFMDMAVIFPPAAPLTTEMAGLVHTYDNVQGTCLAPSIFIEMSKSPSVLSMLEDLQYVTHGRGLL